MEQGRRSILVFERFRDGAGVSLGAVGRKPDGGATIIYSKHTNNLDFYLGTVQRLCCGG